MEEEKVKMLQMHKANTLLTEVVEDKHLDPTSMNKNLGTLELGRFQEISTGRNRQKHNYKIHTRIHTM